MRQGHFTPQRCSNRSPQKRMTFSVVEKGLASGSLVLPKTRTRAQWHYRQEKALEYRIRRANLPERWSLETFPFIRGQDLFDEMCASLADRSSRQLPTSVRPFTSKGRRCSIRKGEIPRHSGGRAFKRHVLPTAHVYKLASECCFSYSLCSQAARIGVATSRGDHPHRRRRRGPGRLWVRSDGA
jgi:hypothetical protein